jgi:hypothetical protein
MTTCERCGALNVVKALDVRVASLEAEFKALRAAAVATAVAAAVLADKAM